MKKAFYVLEDFEENLKPTKGKNYVAKCPECGKWNLYISKASGLYNCFTGGCEFKGILQDFLPDKPLVDDSATSGSFYPKGKKIRFAASCGDSSRAGHLRKGDGGVRMLPTDYKRLSPETSARHIQDMQQTVLQHPTWIISMKLHLIPH